LPFQLAVSGNDLIAFFPGAHAAPFELTAEGEHLARLRYATVGDTLALIARIRFPLHDSGSGYRVGTLPRGDGRSRTLYLDFAPGLRGEAVRRLLDLSETELAAAKPPAEISRAVVIDVGHGGEDPGASSDYAVEKELTLSVGLKLKALLEKRGIKVVMTREGDHLVRLEDRAAFAVPSEHNLFISLHANATERGDAEGIETWVFGEPQDDSVIELAVLENGGGDLGRTRTAQSQELAASIDGDLLREENLNLSTKLAETVQRELVAGTGGHDRGVRKNYFAVIHDARIPAVLVEMGFVNHPVEGPKLATDAYQVSLAEALDAGIGRFLEQGGALAGTGGPAAGGSP
jgi:N-acetylmuramoyl-L-alanine amidase